MNRSHVLAACVVLSVLLAGCGPAITVSNKTGFAVRAIVKTADGSNAVSPSPGESSFIEAGEGNYSVTAIPDADWINYAQTVRKLLNEQFAQPDNLTGPQLLKLTQRLKEIAAKMDAFRATAGKGASCSGNLTQEGGGTVNISQASDGSLLVSC